MPLSAKLLRLAKTSPPPASMPRMRSQSPVCDFNNAAYLVPAVRAMTPQAPRPLPHQVVKTSLSRFVGVLPFAVVKKHLRRIGAPNLCFIAYLFFPKSRFCPPVPFGAAPGLSITPPACRDGRPHAQMTFDFTELPQYQPLYVPIRSGNYWYRNQIPVPSTGGTSNPAPTLSPTGTFRIGHLVRIRRSFPSPSNQKIVLNVQAARNPQRSIPPPSPPFPSLTCGQVASFSCPHLRFFV